MNARIYAAITGYFVSLCAFIFFASSIYQNTIPFVTDEMYWIQTGRMLPHILNQKLDDIYWQEHPGFTNFNGAKWVFALGLRLFGHTDFSSINYPPTHLEQFLYTDNTSFPSHDPFYPFVLHGRLIAAFFTSLSVGLMFIFALLIFRRNYPAALLASALLCIHPATVYIATHALADSMLLFSELSTFALTTYVIQSRRIVPSTYFILIGIFIGYGVSVKINGLMFYVVFMMTSFIWTLWQNKTIKQYIWTSSIVSASALATFLLLHPNFFFFPTYTIVQMIQDRIQITRYHMAYFANSDPPHVLFTLQDRLAAIYHHVFSTTLHIFFLLGTISSAYTFIRHKMTQGMILLPLQWLNAIIICEFLLLYAVFNDLRYFLPLVPLVAIIAVSWIPVVMTFSFFTKKK